MGIIFSGELEKEDIKPPINKLSYWWSSDKDGKNIIKRAEIYDIIYFHLQLDTADSTAKVSLYNENTFSDDYMSIGRTITLNNRKGVIELDFTLLLERDDDNDAENNTLSKWKKVVNDERGDDIELYWKIEYSKGVVKLDDAVLDVFIDIHMINILDNHYRYSCHGGWIDKHHFNTSTKRKRSDIGAENLWKQIQSESGYTAWKTSIGFSVKYTQDMGAMGITLGETKKYWVKKGLDLDTKKRIAMTIFQEVSLAFEKFQGNIVFAAKEGPNESSYEPSDLVSNLLGLYSILENETPEQILKPLNVLDARTSLKIYRQYVGTFSKKKYKNKKFTPLFFENNECTHTPKCTPKFPEKYQKIKIMPKSDNLFRDWDDLFDLHGGVPPINGAKY